MRLTTPQAKTLTDIARITECGEYDGFAPYRPGEHRTVRSLVEKGLVCHVAFGECGDGCMRAGDCPHPVQIYTLSAAGKLLAAQAVR